MLAEIGNLNWIAVIVAIGVVAFGYLGDLSPEQNSVTAPVELDGN